MPGFDINLKRHDTKQYQLELDGRDLLVFNERELEELISQYNELRGVE